MAGYVGEEEMKRMKQPARKTRNRRFSILQVGYRFKVGEKEYETGQKIGKGKFGIVFEVKETSSEGFNYALKQLAFTEKTLFNEYKQIGRQLNHRNLVRYFNCKIAKDWVGLLCDRMERSLRAELKAYVAEGTRMEQAKILRYALDIVSGLNYLHNARKLTCGTIIHFDVRSRNILVVRGNCKLADFGISVDYPGRQNYAIYSYGEPWCAPELKDNQISEKADIYSFGAVLWELLYTRVIKQNSDLSLGSTSDSLGITGNNLLELVKQCRSIVDERPGSQVVMQKLYDIGNDCCKRGGIPEKDKYEQIIEAVERGDKLWFHNNSWYEVENENGSLCEVAQLYSYGDLSELFKTRIAVVKLLINNLNESRIADAKSLIEQIRWNCFRQEKYDVEVWKKLELEKDQKQRIRLLFLESGLKFNGGRSAIHLAAEVGDVDVLKYLLECGMVMDAKDDEGATALHVAATTGKLEAIHFLLANGGQVDAKDKSGRTPLHYAAFFGHPQIITALLEKDHSQINAQEADRQTPLHAAAKVGRIEAIKVLLMHGANIQARNKSKRTALHFASNRGQREAVTCLLNEGANIEEFDRLDQTPLHAAAKAGRSEVVELLLNNRANINAKDSCERTALHVAAHFGMVRVMNCLLEKKADTKITDKDGFTPLHSAAKAGKVEAIECLLKYGAEIDAQNHAGDTALHIAASGGLRGVIGYLLDSNAQRCVRNNAGDTPLDLAKRNPENDAADLLERQ